MADDDLVTIATFPEPAEANLARGVLEGAGFAVNLRSETANSMVPVAFETQLQVSRADEAEAREVLAAAPLTDEEVAAAELAGEQGQ